MLTGGGPSCRSCPPEHTSRAPSTSGCPWTHRLAITRELAGLHDIVTMSYVDDERDGRGWAFRATRGPGLVNGFTLLSQAYEATVEGFEGHAGVPALWDRFTSRVAGNDPTAIGIDRATRFRHLAAEPVETYPRGLRDEIEELDRWHVRAPTCAPTRTWSGTDGTCTGSRRSATARKSGCPAPDRGGTVRGCLPRTPR
ncbi:hypothetical protein AB0J83_43220 [Actinoplanes sp. NPDC049596]|uniref:hypothetical protein n=1 Tax=unclassified Actinoplanes TaxID=2626549 RepID=UPI00342FD4B2